MLLTLIHTGIAGIGLLFGSIVTALIASHSSMRGAGWALYAFAAVAVVGLVGLGVSLYARSAHVRVGQRVAWVFLYAACAIAMAVVVGVVTMIASDR